MPPLTDDPNDPLLGHGSDEKPVPPNELYLVLSKKDRKKGFIRPLREAYIHEDGCKSYTVILSREISETYARDPKFYGSTYCCRCQMHRPVHEFRWCKDGEVVGS
jgi:hypothetical protein